MTRVLWLVYERVPHPDAVSFPATEEDARLVLKLVGFAYPKRLQIAEQLRNFLKQQSALPLLSRKMVPCRRNSGLYHLIQWRLAKWLANVLAAQDAVLRTTGERIRNWLDACGETNVKLPKNGQAAFLKTVRCTRRQIKSIRATKSLLIEGSD